MQLHCILQIAVQYYSNISFQDRLCRPNNKNNLSNNHSAIMTLKICSIFKSNEHNKIYFIIVNDA